MRAKSPNSFLSEDRSRKAPPINFVPLRSAGRQHAAPLDRFGSNDPSQPGGATGPPAKAELTKSKSNSARCLIALTLELAAAAARSVSIQQAVAVICLGE